MPWGDTAGVEPLLLLRVVAAGGLAAVIGWERLTTAASIWATAAIGIAAGSGATSWPVGTTLLLALVLHIFPRIERR